MSRQLPLGGHVKYAAHPHGTVHRHPPHAAKSLLNMTLKEIIQDDISIAQVVEEIAQSMPNRLRHDFGVNIRGRLEQDLVQTVVDLVKKPIALLEWIRVFGILRASAAQKQDRQT